LFARCGRNVKFNPFDCFSYATIQIGDDVYIGPGAHFRANKGLTIGDKVLFGPNVTIVGGDHNTSVVGAYMSDTRVKRPQDDLPVIIEDDVWVGACSIILKGVTIRRGAIVGAGAIVTRDVPPYALVARVPAGVIRYRWPLAVILDHEEKLYPPEKRLSREELACVEP
jgi:acetyltransferase-like isoleucine patch superfamily enzyme